MKKRLAHQISGGSSSGQAPKLKRASTDPLSGAVALGSEQTLQKKLDAIKNTFKQKRVEAYGLRVEGAKQRPRGTRCYMLPYLHAGLDGLGMGV